MRGECLSEERATEIRAEVAAKYRLVSELVSGHFPYPVGRPSAEKLGYERDWLRQIPEEVVGHFIGVGNPFQLRRPERGERVLDIGCGCGLDVYVASLLVGAEGRSVGVDLTHEMLARPEGALAAWPLCNLEFREATAESLPFGDSVFDQVISNGVLNLVTDKDRAFREIWRVLRPGGTFAAADLLVVETMPPEVRESTDAWSS